MEGGTEGERETREEVKCNRGFIVCGSLGRERSERRREKAAERGEETREEGDSGNQCVGRGHSVKQPCSVSLQTGGLTIISLMLSRRQPAH